MMRRRVGLVVVLLVAAAGWVQAQTPREPVDLQIVSKIKDEGLKRSLVMETLSFLTDVHGPRLTGSPHIRRAAEWTAQRLRQWGIERVQLEPWGPFGRGWSLESFRLEMVEPSYAPLIAFPKAWSPSTLTTVRGTPVLLDVSDEKGLDEYRGKLHRAIVLLSPPREVKALFDPPARRHSDSTLLALANSDPSLPRGGRPPTTSNAAPTNAPLPAGAPGALPGAPLGATSQQRAEFALQNRKWQMIYEEGAALVIEPGRGDGGTIFLTAATLPPNMARRSSENASGDGAGQPPMGEALARGLRPWSLDAPAIVPQVVMAVEHYNRLVRMVKKEVPVRLAADLVARYHTEEPMSFNLIAEIPGSDLADEVVMLGGHFDSWHAGTGATDNAVGCGVALEAMRILKAIGVTPRRTIRLALWTGEEQGLLGSRAYVAEHFGRVIAPSGPPAGRGGGRAAGGGDPAERGGRASGVAEEPAPPAGPAAATGQPLGEPASAAAGAAADAQRPAGPREGGRGGEAARRGMPARYELKPEHERFCAYFNLDNGTGRIRGVYLQGNEAVRPIFRAWLAPFAEMGAATLTLNNTGGTDHLSFDAVGLPGFQFIQDPLEYDTRTHHSNMDVYDRLQAEDIQQAAIIMASFVYHAAMREEKLPRKPLVGEVIRAETAAP